MDLTNWLIAAVIYALLATALGAFAFGKLTGRR